MSKQITSKTVQVYQWSDIQAYMCEYLNITPKQFRNYHEVVGGEYKDLWWESHNTIIPDETNSNTIVNMRFLEHEQYFGEEEWKNHLLLAWNAVREHLNLKVGDNILVEFIW